jgi:hypothetical protein
VRFLRRWNPSEQELTTYLACVEPEATEYADGMRRIHLRYPATCARCSQPLDVGTRARWDPESKLVLHSRQPCPLPDLELRHRQAAA